MIGSGVAMVTIYRLGDREERSTSHGGKRRSVIGSCCSLFANPPDGKGKVLCDWLGGYHGNQLPSEVRRVC